MCVQLVKVALVYHRDRKALYKWSSFPIVVHNCVVVTTFTVQVKDPQFKTQRRHKSGLRGVMSWCTLSAGHTSPRRAESGRTSSIKLCQIKHADPSTVPTPWEIKEVGCTPNFWPQQYQNGWVVKPKLTRSSAVMWLGRALLFYTQPLAHCDV